MTMTKTKPTLLSSSLVRRSAKLGATALVAVALAGCTFARPIKTYHGYVPDQERVEKLQAGTDNKRTVESTLGTPSSLATFDQDTWYYITSEQETFAFFETKTTRREILAVRFAEDGTLSKIDKYTLEDGKIVNYSDDETPTRGKELTLLEQLFGTIGRGVPIPGTAGPNVPGQPGR